jgi:hypothetical protein
MSCIHLSFGTAIVSKPKHKGSKPIAPHLSPQENSGNPASIPASNLPPTPSQGKRPTGGKYNTPIWKKILESAAVWIALGLLVVNIFQSCATQKAAKAAEDSVKQARDTSRLDQRAWVSVKGVKLTTQYTAKTAGEATVMIANTERTPALNVAIVKSGFSLDREPELLPASPMIQMVEAPGSTEDTIFIGIPPTPEGTRIYIKFVIEYWDVFQKLTDPPHTTTFCGFYPTTRPPFFFNCPNSASTMN